MTGWSSLTPGRRQGCGACRVVRHRAPGPHTHRAVDAGDVVVVQRRAAGVGVAVGGAPEVRVGGDDAPVHEAERQVDPPVRHCVRPELWWGARAQPNLSAQGRCSHRPHPSLMEQGSATGRGVTKTGHSACWVHGTRPGPRVYGRQGPSCPGTAFANGASSGPGRDPRAGAASSCSQRPPGREQAARQLKRPCPASPGRAEEPSALQGVCSAASAGAASPPAQGTGCRGGLGALGAARRPGTVPSQAPWRLPLGRVRPPQGLAPPPGNPLPEPPLHREQAPSARMSSAPRCCGTPPGLPLLLPLVTTGHALPCPGQSACRPEDQLRVTSIRPAKHLMPREGRTSVALPPTVVGFHFQTVFIGSYISRARR